MKPASQFLISLGILVVSTTIFCSCDKSFKEIIDTYGADPGVVLKDTSLNIDPTTSDVQVSFDKVHIEIPKNTIPDEATLTVKEYDPAEEEQFEDFEYSQVYDVTIEGYTQFSRDIFISLDFDNEQVPEKFESGLFPMFYNDSLRQWERFDRYEIDTVANRVVITTRHLTKLSWFSPYKWLNYTDLYSTGAFNIYWKSGTIPSNSAYNSPNSSLYALSKEPHYILDMERYLQEARAKYQTHFYLSLPGLGYNIFVDDLGSAEGKKDFITSSIYIDNSQNHNDLRSVCAHELMHVVQDYYYNMSGSVITNAHWWLEATAVNADRFVWQSLLTEKETQANENFIELSKNLDRSWDDCDKEPDFYRAGCFLSYLTWYRKSIREGGTGPFLKGYLLDSMLIYVGENGPLSSVAETLDEYLKTKGDTLGVLYDEFIRWVITQGGDLQLFLTDGFGDYQKWQTEHEVNNDQDTYSGTQTIPSLGVRAFKIFNTFEPSDQILVDIEDYGPDVEIYFCGEKKDGNVFNRVSGPISFDLSNPFTISTSGADRCVDILCINQNNSSEEDVSVKINALLPFYYFVFKFSMYTESSGGKWLDYRLTVTKPNGIGDVFVESRSQENLTLSVVASLSQISYPDSPKTTIELTLNSDCTKIIKCKVHAYHLPIGIGEKSTVDFTIENLPLEKNGDRAYSKFLPGPEAWSHLTHFSLESDSRSEHGVFNKNAGSIEVSLF